MATFRAICAKNGTKVELVIRWASVEEARHDLHKQGYSILDIHEVQEVSAHKGGVFYFDISLGGQIKSGQIGSDDILKAYIKLVDDLKQNVIAIYESKEDDDETKKITTFKVKTSYDLYRKKERKDEEVPFEPVAAPDNDGMSASVLREIEKYQSIIERIIQKLDTLMVTYREVMTDERLTRLKNFSQQLKQLKSSTNFDRMKIICEGALLKIWEIESELTLKMGLKEKKQFLEQTNALLKEVGSGKNVTTKEEQDADVMLILKKGILMVKEAFSEGESTEKKPEKDTSFAYYKNLKELDVYTRKSRQLGWEIFKARLMLQYELLQRLMIKRKLIMQNIAIAKKRLGKNPINYSAIVSGVTMTNVYFFSIIRFLASSCVGALVIVSVLYLSGYTFFSPHAFFVWTCLALVTLCAKGMRSITSFLTTSVALVAGIYYLFINF